MGGGGVGSPPSLRLVMVVWMVLRGVLVMVVEGLGLFSHRTPSCMMVEVGGGSFGLMMVVVVGGMLWDG